MKSDADFTRYHRQSLLPQVGREGQARLSGARVLLVGCGALGTVVADYLVRAGVGGVTMVDRDLVELTNLQRQTLFDESDVTSGAPKAVAAVERLRKVNATVELDAVVADVHSENIEALAGVGGRGAAGRVDVIVDGTDNAETRYLINDVANKHGVPWVYGAAVGAEGRVMVIDPPRTACLRCLFPDAPLPGELQTCDTTGVLGPVAGVVASLQAAATIRLIVGGGSASELATIDAWTMRLRSISTADGKRPDCPACGSRRRYDFLDAPPAATTALCGRDSVQLRPRAVVNLDLSALATRWRAAGEVDQSPYLLRLRPRGERESITLFRDGRVIIHGTTDPARARSVRSRFVGD
jgi:molybdopterin/thiamine biosynthesis adenylyltransferase